jgi:hypothetical protein
LDLRDLAAPLRTIPLDALKRVQGATHALLIVNAKVAVIEKSSDAPALSQGELLLFVVYGCAALGIRGMCGLIESFLS